MLFRSVSQSRYSRGFPVTIFESGTIYENFPTIEASLSKALPMGNFILDGEIMSDDFQSMQKSAFAVKRGSTVGDVKYHIFDTIPFDEWQTGNFKLNKTDRIRDLMGLFSTVFRDIDNLVNVEQQWVNSLDDIYKLERTFISQGYEGAMFLPDVPYYLGKKSNRMLKFKTMLTQEVEVLSFYEGEKDSKYEGTMGGLVVLQENGLQCKCGSGFKEDERDYMWTNQKLFLGKIFEVAYQEMSPDGIMRFPVFKRWRDEKAKL